jgi:hypothetical protein
MMSRRARDLAVRLAAAAAAGAVLLLADAPPAEAQCAMCRRALQSPEGQQLLGAFRDGIFLLLAAPFAVFAVIAGLAVRRFR